MVAVTSQHPSKWSKLKAAARIDGLFNMLAPQFLSRKHGLSFEQDLLTLFVVQQRTLSLAMPILATLIAAAALTWAPISAVGAWLSFIFVCQGIQLILCRDFLRLDPRKTDLVKWGSRLATSELVYAIAWSSLLITLWDPASEVQRAFLVALLMVVVSIRLVLASHFLPIMFAGTVPITLAIALRCGLEGTPLYLAMSGIAIIGELYFIQLAKKIQKTARNMLVFKAQKDALIAELEEAKARSDEARRRAEESNFAKSRFLATVSHELRTPLNAIIGFSDLMKSEMLGPHSVPIYKEYSDDVHSAGQHLLGLINDILDITRLDAKKYQLHESAIKVQNIARDCVRMVQLKADAGDVTMHQVYEAELPQILADERAVKQIWLNLLSNAIKFTPEGGTVEVRVQRTRAGTLQISVQDTGPGIPKEEIPKVLEPFGQSSLTYALAKEGAGLGLPIIQALVELHGGCMVIRSDIGEGTEVIIEFPAERTLYRGLDQTNRSAA
jgi:two-component system cell cycle sensor histidine kinase PleC